MYDCEGYFVGAGIAEKLANDGFRVELVSPFPVIAPFCDETLEGALLRRRLHDQGIALRGSLTIHSFHEGRAAAETDLGEHVEISTDALVLVTQRVSNEQLYLFLAPFFGLVHAAWKLLRNLKKKWLSRGQLSIADHEMPFGPYLSMAAATLLLLWPWLWRGWARNLFATLSVIFWWMFGIYVDLPD